MLGHTERRGKEKIKMFLCLSDEPVQVHCGMFGWKHSTCLNPSYFLCLLQPSSSSPSSCQINKAFRISGDVAPHWFTDCQPATNHSIPVSTYNSSVSVSPSLLSSLCYSTFLTLCSPTLRLPLLFFFFPATALRFLTCCIYFIISFDTPTSSCRHLMLPSPPPTFCSLYICPH